MLNVTEKTDRIRNDLAIGPASDASIVTNRHFAQSAPSFVRAMKMQQPTANDSRNIKKIFMKIDRGTRCGEFFVVEKSKGKIFNEISGIEF